MSKKKHSIESINADDSLYPLLPLRDMVVFPGMVVPLFVGRPKSMAAIDTAMQHKDSKVLLFGQQNPEVSEPGYDDLLSTGTYGQILQRIALPDGTTKVLVEGIARVHLSRYVEVDSEKVASYGEHVFIEEDESGKNLSLLSLSLIEAFKDYVKTNRKIPAEVVASLEDMDKPARISDIVAAQMNLSLSRRQELLSETSVETRIEMLLKELEGYSDINDLEQVIRKRVKSQMDKNQKEYYLNEQMKAIQKELQDVDDEVDDLAQLADKIAQAGMPDDTEKKAKAELNKLKQMSPMSSEAAVIRNYIDWLVKMPWQSKSSLKASLVQAEKILNRDHHGLDKVKDRLIEHLAVQKRTGKVTGSIICLVGPPGVGKTSLGKSIAEATNREFARIALGGVRDEAEIRGHRRTYIGALPGKIVQTLSKVGSKNPVILLDEIDKMSQDFRGDPSSALLEVLDPEQNSRFGDHFLEVDFDLSEVLFIATANSMNIPGPLLDRMEVVRLPGYTEAEKVAIADKYLYPKQRDKHGLNGKEIAISKGIFSKLVRHYTREAGVRNLEREIASICRKSVRALNAKSVKKVLVNDDKLVEYLGPEKYRIGLADEQAEIGRVTGLAWTSVGGDLLSIEAVAYSGSGKLSVSGSLGDVMKESIRAALTTIRAKAESFGLSQEQFNKTDIHVHVPDGATPKDGPSAGIAMCTVLISAIKSIPIDPTLAMTGEVTLSGRVMPIGGLKEKLIAAHRGGIKKALIPTENHKDLHDVPDEILNEIEITPVKSVEQVLEAALLTSPYASQTDDSGLGETYIKTAENSSIENTSQRH